MNFTLMYDATPIAIAKVVNESQAIMKLLHPIPLKYLPPGMFRDGISESMSTIIKWMKTRVFPQERVDCDKLLNEMKLDKYDAWIIAKQTRATLMTDCWWIALDKTDTYENQAMRGLAGIPPDEVYSDNINDIGKI